MKVTAHLLEREIYENILEAVSEHRLPPGAKLTEESLAQIFGTSRTTVRRALVRLEHDKVVAFRPHRGAFVAQPSVEEARQVFQARRTIEGSACRMAAGHVSPEDAQRLENLARRACENQGVPEEVKLSGKFHSEIAALGGNDILRAFVDELLLRSSLIVALYQRPGESDCSFEEHMNVLDALVKGDGARAAETMIRHLHHVEASLDLRPPLDSKVDLDTVFKRRAARLP